MQRRYKSAAALALAFSLSSQPIAAQQNSSDVTFFVGAKFVSDTNLFRVEDEIQIPAFTEGSGLEAPLRRLVEEITEPGFGSRAMIRALLLQCMIDLLRRRLGAGDPALGWMGALKDRSLWLALRRMLDAPGDPHSVDSLAAEAGMSRSTFAKRFADAYGRGPMELLRDLRMRHAATLLAETDLPVKRIAEMAGFRSRSAFTRTFEALIGASPRAFRRE